MATVKKKHLLRNLFILVVVILAGVYIYENTKPQNMIYLDVIDYNQHPDYPTGCESASLYILLQYYGVDVTMEEIVEALPKGPTPYEVDGVLYGANPEREFVGDPRDLSSYGVFNEPIRETAEQFKSGAIAKSGATLEDIKEIIANGNPVEAWYTTNIEGGIQYRREWIDYETGETVRWPAYEHAVVIYGFDDYNNVPL